MEPIAASLSTLPSFIAYFCGAGALTTAFLMLYSGLTPEREITPQYVQATSPEPLR
jgi:hypothetical protein